MKHRLWISLAATVALVGACDRGKTAASAPTGPQTAWPIGQERAEAIRWNSANESFELNGKALKAVKLWTFDGTTEGFAPVGSRISPDPKQGMTMTIVDPTLRSPKGLNVPGGQFPLVLVRLTRTAPGEIWDGALYYSTYGHGEAIQYFGKPLAGAKPKVGETTILIYDMGHQTVGAPDWVSSTIDRIRLDVEDKPGGAFVIRQIAITENPDPGALPPPPTPAHKKAQP